MILFTNRNYADGQLTFHNRVKLTDPVDRVLAGDQLDDVATDFDIRPEELRAAIDVVGNIGGISRPARARMWIGENPVTGVNSRDAQHSPDRPKPSETRS